MTRMNYIKTVIKYQEFMEGFIGEDFNTVEFKYEALAPKEMRADVTEAMESYEFTQLDDEVKALLTKAGTVLLNALGLILGWELKNLTVKARCEGCDFSDIADGGYLQCRGHQTLVSSYPLVCKNVKKCFRRTLEA